MGELPDLAVIQLQTSARLARSITNGGSRMGDADSHQKTSSAFDVEQTIDCSNCKGNDP